MNSESLSECKNLLDFQTLFPLQKRKIICECVCVCVYITGLCYTHCTQWRPVDSGRHTHRLSQTPSPYGNWVSIISLLVCFWKVGETPYEHRNKMQTIRDRKSIVLKSCEAAIQPAMPACHLYLLHINVQLYGNQRNPIHITNESTSTYWHQSTIIFQTLLWFALGQINAVGPERVFLKPHGLYGSTFHITVCSKHTRHQVCPNY